VIPWLQWVIHFRPQLTHQPASHFEDPSLRRRELLVLWPVWTKLLKPVNLDKQIYHRARAKYKAELVETDGEMVINSYLIKAFGARVVLRGVDLAITKRICTLMGAMARVKRR